MRRLVLWLAVVAAAAALVAAAAGQPVCPFLKGFGPLCPDPHQCRCIADRGTWICRGNRTTFNCTCVK